MDPSFFARTMYKWLFFLGTNGSSNLEVLIHCVPLGSWATHSREFLILVKRRVMRKFSRNSETKLGTHTALFPKWSRARSLIFKRDEKEPGPTRGPKFSRRSIRSLHLVGSLSGLFGSWVMWTHSFDSAPCDRPRSRKPFT